MSRVLIADDHGVVREGLRRVLSRMPDIEIVGEAANGGQALEMTRRLEPDLILLDLSMPGGGGLDVLARLKSELPNTPVLVLTMHPEEQYAERAFRYGAMGFVSKGSAVDELLEAVRRVLDGKRYISPELADLLASRLGAEEQAPLHERLSDREYLVMHHLASGQTVSEIADALHLSIKTISTYRSRILEKLKLKNNVELVHYAIRNRLVEV